MKILIIDSDKEFADFVDCEFKKAHYEVRYASDSEAGLKFALESPFDLIVLDWTLPKKDGLGVLKKLRRKKNWTPILVLTAEDSIAEVVQSLDCGANSCVTVPFEIPVLLARMKALIRRSKWDRGVQPSDALPFSAALEG